MITPAQIATQLQAARQKGFIRLFKQSAQRWNVPVAVLLAIASRETKIGSDAYYLANGFTGRDGHGKGIMQIDDRWHTFAKFVNPGNNAAIINYGAKYLSELKERFGGNMKEALAAYNAGPDAVYDARAIGVDPDTFTTGGDYSADVLRRAAMIEEHLGIGGWAKAGLAIIPAAVVLLAGVGYLYQQTSDVRHETENHFTSHFSRLLNSTFKT